MVYRHKDDTNQLALLTGNVVAYDKVIEFINKYKNESEVNNENSKKCN